MARLCSLCQTPEKSPGAPDRGPFLASTFTRFAHRSCLEQARWPVDSDVPDGRGLPLGDGLAGAEAAISMGGVPLTVGQSLAVRVAIQNLLHELAGPAYREHRGQIEQNYEDRLQEVLRLMHGAGLR